MRTRYEKLYHLFGIVIYVGFLIWLSIENYLAFHSISEVSNFMIGFTLLTFFFMSVKLKEHLFAHIVAIGVFISSIVLVFHTLSYQGMNVIEGFGVNEATQFWLVGNIILAISLFIAAIHERINIRIRAYSNGMILLALLLTSLVFSGLFPIAYEDGMTRFKVLVEILIVLIYVSTMFIMYMNKDKYSNTFLIDFIIAVALLAVSEIIFTQYVSVTEGIIIVGHIVKFIGMYILLIGIVNEYLIYPLSKSINVLTGEVESYKSSFKEFERNADIFQSLYDDAPIGYQSLDENGYYVNVNDTYAKMLGYDKSEMIGQFFGDFLTTDSSLDMKNSFKAFKERGSVDVIFNLIHKKGHVIPVRFLGKIAYNSEGNFKQTHCILMDISNEVEYQKGIIQSKEKLEDIIDLIAEGVYTLDANGVCISINERAVELLGYVDKQEIIGKHMHSLIHHHNQDGSIFPEEDCPTSNVIVEGEITLSKRTVFWRKDNTQFEVLLSSFPLEIDGKLIGVNVTFRDKTKSDNIVHSLLNMSYHDTLTGLFNRRYYEEEIKHIDNNDNYPLSIIVADINGLKLINDAFGHYSGDKLLISAAEVFIRHSKKNDFIARIGGDEFIIVMPKTTFEEADKRIKCMMEDTTRYSIKSIELSISFGVMTKHNIKEDFNEIYKSAEDAMYRMKLLDVPSMRSNTIDTIIRTLYEKDVYSEEHSRSVSKISEAIAMKHKLPFQQITEIRTAGILHDIGKIVISKSIISKEGKLTDQEYTEVQKHSEIGFRILNSSKELRQLSETVLAHHEWWNGKGYPQKLKAEQIPLLSRIISVADAFDAMTSERPYRSAFSKEEAIKELKKCSGTQFDPNVVETFVNNFDDIMDFVDQKVFRI